MSCSFCRFWLSDNNYWSGKEVDGECRRYPKTVITSSSHWCGELSIRRPQSLNHMRTDVNLYSNEYNNEKTKRIALEKKLKELRKKLKTGIKNENSTD